MQTIYETNDSGEHIRYVHHSLVVFYLEQANNNALQAREEQIEGVMLSSSLICILFSAIALEAALNEFAEKVLEGSELEDFEFCKRSFKKEKRRSALRCKLNSLLKRKFAIELPDALGVEIDNLSELRNALVHYKLSKYATKLRVHVPNPVAGLTVIDFAAPTEVIEQPIVKKITAEAAVASYNAVFKALHFWGSKEGVEDITPGFELID
jgi:hypothetical protein